jgi:hypothetical protein
MSAGTVAYRKAEHQHTVQVDEGGCWTLLFTGPERRVWGLGLLGEGEISQAQQVFLSVRSSSV